MPIIRETTMADYRYDTDYFLNLFFSFQQNYQRMIAIMKILNNATCFISIDNSLFLKTNYHYIRMVRFKSKRNNGAKTASFEITIHHSHNKAITCCRCRIYKESLMWIVIILCLSFITLYHSNNTVTVAISNSPCPWGVFVLTTLWNTWVASQG